MKNIFTQIRGDYCMECNTARVIECYTKFDKPINYTYLLDQISKGIDKSDVFNNVEISYMMCKKCKTEFFIDWRFGTPVPIRDFATLDIFLNNIY